jgi:hypothetical protein
LDPGKTARGFFGVQKHKKVIWPVVPGILFADFLRFCGTMLVSLAIGRPGPIVLPYRTHRAAKTKSSLPATVPEQHVAGANERTREAASPAATLK